MTLDRRDGLAVPSPIYTVLRSFEQSGQSAWLVGESLHELTLGGMPRSFEVATSASLDQCLQLHANAVPTRLEEATLTIPTSAGPIDITPYRNGKDVDSDLPFRDFTIHAMAYDPVTERWLDPFGGRDDGRAKRLCAVRNPAERLAEAPLRALRAARLCGQLDYRAEPQLLEALRACSETLQQIPTMRARWEISRIVREAGAEAALTFLHEAGLAPALFPGASVECVSGVEALPLDLAVRLAWILRGSRASRALRRLGFGRVTANRVQDLLAYHPIDVRVKGHSESAVRRLLRRLTADDLAALQRMRQLEIEKLPPTEAQRASDGLEALQETMARVREADAASASKLKLALGGREVMQALGLGPGPVVGQALDFLTSLVEGDPALNTEVELREHLARFAKDHAKS